MLWIKMIIGISRSRLKLYIVWRLFKSIQNIYICQLYHNHEITVVFSFVMNNIANKGKSKTTITIEWRECLYLLTTYKIVLQFTYILLLLPFSFSILYFICMVEVNLTIIKRPRTNESVLLKINQAYFYVLLHAAKAHAKEICLL